ncbi:MAG: hypothetical protein U9R37_05960 [Campylobacterota bacterium]|nr:hypothetical protein [Campylobacterota bacterium]
MGDMMIPFIMLLMITIALILERKYHEDKISQEYDEKFETWKRLNPTSKETVKCKELVGLVFKEDDKLNIEVLDKKIIDKLERKKYTIKG